MMSSKKEGPIDLPPGFRFHPTDYEIITDYLVKRIKDSNFSAIAIGEADLNKSEPWDLPGMAIMGEKEWYFFCQRDRKYPTGMRTNRATQSGYWKATGKDKEIFYKGKGCLIGMKKTLVFYKGRAPKGEKSNWVMHEYRLEGKSSFWNLPKSFKDDWVVSRVFHKNTGLMIKNTTSTDHQDGDGDDENENSSLQSSLMESSSYQINNNSVQIHDGFFQSNNPTPSSYMNPNIDYYYNNAGMGCSNPYFYPQMETPTMVYSDHLLHGLTSTRTESPHIRQRYCKIEPYSNTSTNTMSGSPETSVVSRQQVGDTLIVSSSTSTAPLDFDSLLNTYG